MSEQYRGGILSEPHRELDDLRYELLSLRVSEIQNILAMLTEAGDLRNREGCIISALERLTDSLQNEVQEIISDYHHHLKPVAAIKLEGETA